jgi:uncharacterized membrane protein
VLTRRSDAALIVVAAMAEGIVFGALFGGLFSSAGVVDYGLLIATVSALISAGTALIVVAFLPVAGRDTRLVLALFVGAVVACAVAYLIQPIGRPV